MRQGWLPCARPRVAYPHGRGRRVRDGDRALDTAPAIPPTAFGAPGIAIARSTPRQPSLHRSNTTAPRTI